jgi:lipoate-protein ligase A
MAPGRVRWLRLRNVPLLRQLQLEEALFRAPELGTWVLTNTFGPSGYEDAAEPDASDGAIDRHVQAIAMGISGKPELLLNEEAMRVARVPVLRRFTGGGTVVLDRGSLMVSLISGADEMPDVPPHPNGLMAFTATQLYAPLLAPLLRPAGSGLELAEQDYVIGDRKCAGNAQAISGGRWVHHTSFLWDFAAGPMGLLRLPDKRPKYRADRPHGAFLVGLREAGVPSRAAFWAALGPSLERAFGARVEVTDASAADERALAAAEIEAGMRADPPPRIKSALVIWPPPRE